MTQRCSRLWNSAPSAMSIDAAGEANGIKPSPMWRGWFRFGCVRVVGIRCFGCIQWIIEFCRNVSVVCFRRFRRRRRRRRLTRIVRSPVACDHWVNGIWLRRLHFMLLSFSQHNTNRRARVQWIFVSDIALFGATINSAIFIVCVAGNCLRFDSFGKHGVCEWVSEWVTVDISCDGKYRFGSTTIRWITISRRQSELWHNYWGERKNAV